MHASHGGAATGGVDSNAKSAIRGAWVGFFVDMFDIYLPIVVLAPALIYFVSPDLSASATAIVGGSIFAATLIGRPLGAFIFGHYADTIGRRRTTIISVTGFGVGTLLIAFLPGYEQWGITAVALLSSCGSSTASSSAGSTPRRARWRWSTPRRRRGDSTGR
jgi:MFS family permease